MRNLALMLTSFMLLAFESPLLHEASMARYAPDVVLVATVYIGLTSTFHAGLFAALVLGLTKDAFALATPLGMYTEIMAVVFLTTWRLSRQLALQGAIGTMLLAFFFSIGASALELLLSLVFDRSFTAEEGGALQTLLAMLPQALMTAPFGPIVFWILGWVDRLTSRRKDTIYP